MNRRQLILSLLLFLWSSQSLRASTFVVDASESLFGVVVFKEGLASGFAHNHLVFAKDPRITKFEIPEGKSLENGLFEAEAEVAALFIDDYAVSKKWIPALEKAGILNSDIELSDIKAASRDEIQETMRGSTQLDQAKFPKLKIAVNRLIAKSGVIGGYTSTHEAMLAVSIHGVTREIKAPARIELVGSDLLVLCSVALNFTDFGIEPISTALGMVRNQDQFQLFVSLKAKKG